MRVPIHREPSAWRRTAGVALRTVIAGPLLLVCLAASACSGSSDGAPASTTRPAAATTTAPSLTEDESIVVAWARDDLGFGDAADCVGRHVAGIDLEGVDGDQLRRLRLDAVPIQARQRIGDALMVCGIMETDR